MIKIVKNKVYFTGKDYKWLIKISKELGLSPQNAFTGMCWEYVMKKARERKFHAK